MIEARRRFALALLGGSTVACVGTGCAFPATRLQPPVARLDGLSFGRVADGELVLVATLEVDNPNSVEISLSGLRFQMEVFGRPLGSGRAPQPTIVLPAAARARVPIELAVSTRQLVDTLRMLRPEAGTTIPYRLHGSVGWGGAPWPLRFERTGELDGRRLMAEALRAIRPR